MRSELERDYYSTAFAKMQALILKKITLFVSAFRLPFDAKSCILNTETFPPGKEVQKMLTLRGIITLIVLIVLFALAVVWISKQGGWKGEGCGGNCASCHSHCEKQDPNKKA